MINSITPDQLVLHQETRDKGAQLNPESNRRQGYKCITQAQGKSLPPVCKQRPDLWGGSQREATSRGVPTTQADVVDLGTAEANTLFASTIGV
jgi:hypothetical protein